MRFSLQIENVRPIKSISFEVDLGTPGLLCIAGKNGTGKTTLVKAIQNFVVADTFVKTSSDGIFQDTSRILYQVDNEKYLFVYEPTLRSVSSRKPIKPEHKELVVVELPVPYGQRFTFFRTLADQDGEVRQAVVLGRYEKPIGLIAFLTAIYQVNRFEDLVEVPLRRGFCCCFIEPNGRYIREDYFSSGEYFLINLYRMVTSGRPLVVIDEIDVALDACAQSKLAEQLRTLCEQSKSKVVFTSHSLALMQTLGAGELLYLERDPATGATELALRPFNAVKSMLFNFTGYDRYILTEDKELVQFLQYVINRYCGRVFFRYIVIEIAGASQVTGLMRRNRRDQFFGPREHVISILDGDQNPEGTKKQAPEDTYYIPVKNVENAFSNLDPRPGLTPSLLDVMDMDDKKLYRTYIASKTLTEQEIFELICNQHDDAMNVFAQVLTRFLGQPK